MNTTEFFALHRALEDAGDRILGVKGEEYPANDDRLSNFKETAMLQRLAPEQVAVTFLLKHIFAVCSFVREGREDEVGREPLWSRIADARNYLSLLYAILVEQGRAGKPMEERA